MNKSSTLVPKFRIRVLVIVIRNKFCSLSLSQDCVGLDKEVGKKWKENLKLHPHCCLFGKCRKEERSSRE